MFRYISRAKLHKSLRKSLLILTLSTLGTLPILSIASAADSTAPTAVTDEVFKLLQDNHFSAVSPEKLSDNAIKGMVDGLNDPYTVYFTPKEWKGFENALEQNYVGIGVRLNTDENGIFITEIFKGSPAEAGGIKIGDYITGVDGKTTKKVTVDKLIEMVLGEENTNVTITVTRNKEVLDLKMLRKTINLPVVTGKLFEDGTGYIQLSSFSTDADELFAAKLKEFQQNHIRSLVIDLRDNGGGLLDTASNIAKLFIKEGTLIHTNDRNHIDAPITLKGGATVDFPVYVLVNENSASASEVLAGALQDYKLATVIGTKSFGKGSVQSIFPLSNGGVLKVTIEEYLTPKNHKVNKVGITPDIESLGYVPQLITAFQTAGMKEIKLTKNNNEISINNQAFGGENYTIKTVNNKIYVPSRILATLIKGKISWNTAAKAVQITASNKNEVFPVTAGGTLNEKGTTYLELASFSKKFPQLQWSMEKDLLTLQVKGK
ncbi:PDZ domain-containing protein [Paenibacillus psychroresistens]|uniref:PDZ domain-containing protein n=1 Tax=Paenibacillus psychroresistens TaxID=1778678 RepID=A0A6B8RKB3_9BACL|nr:S41 family peptidase [Paenibacillus psychroresistens]QGQ96720.1 PDZ domain-containing protein [Paenibacillus psychroresistens]